MKTETVGGVLDDVEPTPLDDYNDHDAGLEAERGLNEALLQLNESMDDVVASDPVESFGNDSRNELVLSDPIEPLSVADVEVVEPVEAFASVSATVMDSADIGDTFNGDNAWELEQIDDISLGDDFGFEVVGQSDMCDDPGFLDDVLDDPCERGSAPASSVCSTAKDVGFDRAFLQLKPPVPEFIWESSPFLKAVFGKDAIPFPVSSNRLPVPIDVEGPSDLREMLKRPRSTRPSSLCEKTLKYVPQAEDESKRCSILADWACMVGIAPESFNVGRLVLDDGDELTHDSIMNTIRDCFAGKATATLSKRFYAMNRYVNWCLKKGFSPFPVKERTLYAYLQWTVTEGFAASSGRSLLEAVRFCSGVLGMDEDIRIRGTARLDGVATKLSMTAGPIEQAAPLTVQQVCQLERLVISSEDLRDKVMLGCALILVYSCGRVSDGQRAISCILDVDLTEIDPLDTEVRGFLELEVLGNKAARSDKLKRSLLPLVAPIFSLASVDWFRSWLQARELLGLNNDGKLNYPFLTRFDTKHEAMHQSVSSSELGAFLREALQIPSDQRLVRGHSLKTTCLSWAAKYGLPQHTRRLLGHHLDQNAISAETYARDVMAGSVRELAGVLGKIKQGIFMPDATRSGRFKKMDDVPVGQADMSGHEQLAQVGSEHEDSDSDYNPSSDSEISDETGDEEPNEGLLWHVVSPGLHPDVHKVGDNVTVYRHELSGVQHIGVDDESRLLCGRKLHDKYIRYAGPPVRAVHLCDTCKHKIEQVLKEGES